MYYVIFGLLGAALLAADQWVKAWTVAHLELWETAPLFPGFLELMRVHNYGAAWSSFSGQRWLLLGVTGIIVLAVLWVLVRKIVRHPLGILAGCLIVSGGLGNIIDRLRKPPIGRTNIVCRLTYAKFIKSTHTVCFFGLR